MDKCVCVYICVCTTCAIWRENTYGQSHRTRIPFGTLFSLQREKERAMREKTGVYPHRDATGRCCLLRARKKVISRRSPRRELSFTPRESSQRVRRCLYRVSRTLRSASLLFALHLCNYTSNERENVLLPLIILLQLLVTVTTVTAASRDFIRRSKYIRDIFSFLSLSRCNMKQ